MKVLITGGAGFIGSHIAEECLKDGMEVCVVDTFATGRRVNVPPKAILVEASVACKAAMTATFQIFQPNLMVHCAAAYKDPENFVEDAVTNTVGAANLALLARKHQTRIIYFQTALCYGLHPKVNPVPIDAELRPLESSYAISKTAAEHYLMRAEVPAVSFRLANMYGPRNLSGPVPAFYRRIMAGEPCSVSPSRRDFVFIKDALHGVFMKAVRKEYFKSYYHVSSGTDRPIIDVFNAVVKATGRKAEANMLRANPDDAETILLDPKRTQEDFIFFPDTKLDDGVREACEWYDKHGLTETYTHLKR